MKKLLYILMILFLMISCSDKNKNSNIEEKGKLYSDLIQQHQKIDSLNNISLFDIDEYRLLIVKTIDFYDKYPEEPPIPQLLWKSGLSAMTIARDIKDKHPDEHEDIKYFAEKGIELFTIIHKVYPDYQNAKATYLNKGIIYDDILEDYDNAREEYNEYIRKNPEDSSTLSLKHYIQFLGKSPDEILESFTPSEE